MKKIFVLEPYGMLCTEVVLLQIALPIKIHRNGVNLIYLDLVNEVNCPYCTMNLRIELLWIETDTHAINTGLGLIDPPMGCG